MATPPGTIELTEIIFPEHSNHYGTLFAGHALQLMSKAAFLAGRSLARSDVVMASVSGAEFLSPIPVGHVLTLRAWVSRIGRSSLTVCVTGLTETLGAAQREVLKGVFEMVAVEPATGRPVPIDRSHLKKATP
jgi:acyl-CoA hydrolase